MGFECKICNYKTTRKSNLERHRQSKKHQRLALIAQHSEITKKHDDKAKKPSSPKPVKEKPRFICHICLRRFNRLYHLQRHQNKIKKCEPPAVSKTETTTVTEIHNIQFYLPEWLSMEEFIENLQTSHKLTYGETQDLLKSFDQNLLSYRSCLSKTLTENCYRQLLTKNDDSNDKNNESGEGSDSEGGDKSDNKVGNPLLQPRDIGNIRPVLMGLLAKPEEDPREKMGEIISISNSQVFNHHQRLIELQIEHQREVVKYLCENGFDQELITNGQDQITNVQLEEVPQQINVSRKKTSLKKHQTKNIDNIDNDENYDLKCESCHEDDCDDESGEDRDSENESEEDCEDESEEEGESEEEKESEECRDKGDSERDYTFFNPNETYQQIIDCAISYLVNSKRQVFQLEEPHHYVGMYCHDDDCPCEQEGEIEIRDKCWFYIQYAVREHGEPSQKNKTKSKLRYTKKKGDQKIMVV